MLSANSILFSRRRFITTISLFTLSIVILCPFVRLFGFTSFVVSEQQKTAKKRVKEERQRILDGLFGFVLFCFCIHSATMGFRNTFLCRWYGQRQRDNHFQILIFFYSTVIHISYSYAWIFCSLPLHTSTHCVRVRCGKYFLFSWSIFIYYLHVFRKF